MRKLLLVILLFCSFSNNTNSLNSKTTEYNSLSDKFTMFKLKQENIYKVFDYIPLVSPIKLANLTKISNMFGMRQCHPILRIPRMHNGIDFVANYGTAVYATASGVVKLARYNKYGYGNNIIVQHDSTYKTRYAHLSKIIVNEGDIVKTGQKIGEVGSSGLSTGPHLHYELIKDNLCIDPTLIYGEKMDKDRYMTNLDLYERYQQNNHLDMIKTEMLASISYTSINQKL